MAFFSKQDLQSFAREVVESAAEEIDFMGVGEQFGDQWSHLSPEEYEQVQRAVHDLACSAVVTVTWPAEEPT